MLLFYAKFVISTNKRLSDSEVSSFFAELRRNNSTLSIVVSSRSGFAPVTVRILLAHSSPLSSAEFLKFDLDTRLKDLLKSSFQSKYLSICRHKDIEESEQNS